MVQSIRVSFFLWLIGYYSLTIFLNLRFFYDFHLRSNVKEMLDEASICVYQKNMENNPKELPLCEKIMLFIYFYPLSYSINF